MLVAAMRRRSAMDSRITSLILRCHVPETAKSDKLFEESHEDSRMSILFGLCVASQGVADHLLRF